MPVPLVLLGSVSALPFSEPPVLFPPDRAAADPVAEPEIRLRLDRTHPELLSGMLLTESETVIEAYAGIARITLHQWFTNPHDDAVDGAYLLPLPDSATLDAAEIRCEQAHHAAVAVPEQTDQPAADSNPFLLDSDGVFVWALPEVCAGAVSVTVQYLLPITTQDGRFQLDLPPPPLAADGLPWEQTGAPDRTLTVYIDERMPVTDLLTDGKPVPMASCAHRYGQVASLSPEPGEPMQLSWALSGAAALTWLPDPDQPGYLSLTVDPAVLGRLPDTVERELLFVVDGSCSMRGTPFETARATVLQTLEGLTEGDTFNLYAMGQPSALFDAPQTVDATSRQAAEDWLSAFNGGSSGGAEGLHAALASPGSDAHRQLLLLTDGHLDDTPLHDALATDDSGTRIHPVGLGPYANQALLTRLADAGRGVAVWPEPGETPAQTAERLQPHLAAPALSNLQIDWGGLAVTEQIPAQIPDMLPDTPLRVLARYEPGASVPTTVRLQGRLDQTPIALELSVPPPDSSNEALGPLWATEKIRTLSLVDDDDPEAVRAAIVELALEHGLASRYTTLTSPAGDALRDPSPESGPVSAALTELEWAEAPPVALTRPPPPPPRRDPRQIRMSTVGMNLPSGDSTAHVIALIDARQAQIETCYQDRLQYRPQLSGSVAIEVEVVAGKASTLAVVENTTGDDWLAKCAVRRIKGWDYPESFSGEMYLPFALATLD